MHFWKKVEDAEKIGVLKTEKMSNVKENVENKVLKLRGTKKLSKSPLEGIAHKCNLQKGFGVCQTNRGHLRRPPRLKQQTRTDS